MYIEKITLSRSTPIFSDTKIQNSILRYLHFHIPYHHPYHQLMSVSSFCGDVIKRCLVQCNHNSDVKN